MSDDRFETARQAHATFNRRDREAWLALCDPELEVVPTPEWPESDAIRGREAAWDFYVEANSPWEGSPADIYDMLAVGDDMVVGDVRAEIRGTASGAVAEFRRTQLITFRDGLMVRHDWFADRPEALAAAGVAER